MPADSEAVRSPDSIRVLVGARSAAGLRSWWAKFELALCSFGPGSLGGAVRNRSPPAVSKLGYVFIGTFPIVGCVKLDRIQKEGRLHIGTERRPLGKRELAEQALLAWPKLNS